MAPAHYSKTALLPLIRCGCPRTLSRIVLSAPQKIRLLIITIAAVCLTTLGAVSEDGGTTRPATQPEVSSSAQQKIFREGDTLTSILKESRVADEDILEAIRLLAKKVKLNQIHVGQTLDLYLDEPVTDALVVDVVESQRPRLERFMPTLSTIITAAPMLGILGTVLGIISSFEVIGQAGSAGDPSLVSQGIAEALLTTAAGLIVALLVLIPYNLFRSQVDRTLGRIETLVAAIQGPRTIEKSKD